uniref:DUF1097 domain-containing protein n=1 Tax=Ndongobacter massiliensis TaxID=1871025 RepID=UPI000930F1E4|nr:DUF1097 domain-containing protein [Ndongobacter massiliensis]
MNKELKKNLWWSFFITVFAVIYAVIYNLLPIPNPAMWCTYVTLPIFFLHGGDLKVIPKLCVCAVCGFLWGLFCLWLMAISAGWGFMPSLIFGVFISVLLCCAFHMGFALNTIFGSCPTVFGGFAVCFATGGANGVTMCLTMIAGVLLGGIMAITGKCSEKLAGLEENGKEVA